MLVQMKPVLFLTHFSHYMTQRTHYSREHRLQPQQLFTKLTFSFQGFSCRSKVNLGNIHKISKNKEKIVIPRHSINIDYHRLLNIFPSAWPYISYHVMGFACLQNGSLGLPSKLWFTELQILPSISA